MGFQDDFGDQAPDEVTRTMVKLEGITAHRHDSGGGQCADFQQQRTYRQSVASHAW